MIENAVGGAGNDKLTGNASANVIDGADGNDTVNGAAGDDTLIGGNGSDKASFTGAGSGVNANLSTGSATGDGNDTLSGFENLQG